MSSNIKRLLIVISCLVAVVAILRWFYHSMEQNREEFVSETQHALNHTMRTIKADEAVVLDYLKSNLAFDFEALSALETNYPFYVYKSNQLVFWSDKVIFSELNRKLDEGWHFYNGQGGQFLLLARKSKEADILLLFVCDLYTNYGVNNDYVQSFYNNDVFSQDNIFLTENKATNAYALRDIQENELFYIMLGNGFTNHHAIIHFIIIVLEVAIFLCVILLFWLFCGAIINDKPGTALFIFVVSMIIFRLLMWWLSFPFMSAQVSLFNPKFFASSDFNPSFGALLINSIMLFATGIFIIKYLNNLIKKKALTYNLGLSVFLSFSTYAIFLFIYGFIELIYKHSQWGLDIYNTINPDIFKLLSVCAFLLFGLFVFYIVHWIHGWIAKYVKSDAVFIKDQCLGLLLFIPFAILIKAPFLWIAVIVFLLNLLVHFFKLSNQLYKISFISFIYLFLFVSAVSVTAAWSTYDMERFKKQNEQASFANRLFNNSDVLAEYLLSQMDGLMKNDRQIKNQFLLPITPYSSVANKIKKYYLSDYFEKYEQVVTIYDGDGNTLYPVNGINFSAKYEENQLVNKNKRAGIALYLIGGTEESQINKKYIYLYECKLANYTLATIAVELIPKKLQPDNVFPELLVDKRFVPDVEKAPYNYAVYVNDTLDYKVGDMSFPDFIANGMEAGDIELRQDGNDIASTAIRNGNQTVVFAETETNLFSIFSKFSYFFILCFTLILAFSVYYFGRAIIEKRQIGLSAKIQLFFSLSFLVPLLSISVSTISFVNVTFLGDIVKSYQERISRVGNQLTPVIMNFDNGVISKETLNNELLNTTKMVNSDLNLFNLNGKLLTTSQPQIFEKKLQSTYINNKAYAEISFGNKKLLTVEEQIGSLNYKTTYAGIYSYNSGKLIAILSSPFFKSSKEYDALLANLLTNVFNIFVASFIIFIMLAYTATKVLTQPLNLLKNKLAIVNLSERNEPLEWPVEDEIGLLISEYNQMLLKLEKSKLALAKTEKESAWREMAQQVAHEIKNPLTPMKLSLQHLSMRLEREGNDSSDAAQKIKSILSQIDNLSDIATSFSSFAKMPIPDNDRTNVAEILRKVVSLFKAENNVINLKMASESVFALVDHKIIERIFNNIIINALQSEKPVDALHIEIELAVTPNKVLISFTDNGIGIPEDSLNKIFLPNFTTKQEGSGIGLAIAKRGIEYAGGKIWVESEIDKGATFNIELQKMD